jgi:hypothetical protein
MKIIFSYIGFSILILLAFSCNYVEGLYVKGEQVKTEIYIDEFSRVSVETHVNLVLEQSNEEFAVVSGLDFKVEDIQISVKNEELVISSKVAAHSRKDQMPTVLLPIKELSFVNVNAPMELSAPKVLEIDNFTLIVNGRGTYSNSNLHLNCKKITVAAYGENLGVHYLMGNADILNITMEGLAYLKALEMNVKEVNINQRSLKNCFLHCTDQLNVRMYSSGNVYYTGHPNLNYTTFDPGWNVAFGLAINQAN